MTEITEILYQWMQSVSQRQIVKLTGTSRNTVRKIIEAATELGLQPECWDEPKLLLISGQIETKLKSHHRPQARKAQTQLEQHHQKIKDWLDEPHMTIRQIRRLLLEHNPSLHVSETSCHRYVKRHFPKPIQSTMVLHTLPGQQAQVDFGYVGIMRDPSLDKERRTYAFVMTLSYSRYRFVRFVFKQDVAAWID